MKEVVIMNTKHKTTMEDAVKWFEHPCTILDCIRKSDRGKVEKIYILGAISNYADNGEILRYVVDTGRGYGGRGSIVVHNSITIKNLQIVDTADALRIDEKQKLPIYVFK